MATLSIKPTCSVVARRSNSVAVAQPSRSRRTLCTRALLGPDGKPGAEGKKKSAYISRDEEPEQYWGSKFESDGGNPLRDPLAIMGIVGIFFPFILLGIAIATGYIDVSVYR